MTTAAHWSEKYLLLGLLYDEKTFNCATFVERVRREVFGHELTLPSEHRPGAFGRNAQIAENLQDFVTPTETPTDGDGVILITRGRVQHIGLVCVIAGERYVIHNIEGVNVTRRRIRDLETWGYELENFYKWI